MGKEGPYSSPSSKTEEDQEKENSKLTKFITPSNTDFCPGDRDFEQQVDYIL